MKTWHYANSSSDQAQAPETELPGLVEKGAITPQTKVWSSGMANWEAAGEVLPQLFGHSASPAGPPPVPAGPPVAAAAMQVSHEIDYEIFGDDMQIVEVELDPGETVIAEAGAMNYLEPDITFEAKMGDGSTPNEGMMGKLLSVGKRALTGESIFMTHFTHSGGGGKRRAAFAAPFPGKIIPIDLKEVGGEITCQKDSFLCAAFGTQVTIAFNRKLGAGFFGGEGFILQKLRGDGKAFVHAGGTITERVLNGETLRVDTGCLVAFSPGIEYNIERAGNLKSMFFGGEGLFLATLTGHGKVWLQSLPFSRLADRVIKSAPAAGGKAQGEGSVLGGLGRLIDGD
ncbi:MAG: TIGR00266 family protein [Verrucomicrobiales bacterium]|nr:TIGR00266 family protein [Verrucomicrobiales bacterium]